MKVPGILLGILLLATAAMADLVVTDLRLVDPAAREVLEGSVLIEGGRIGAIGPADGAGFADEIPRWSGEGRFALPAMLDTSTFASVQVSPGHRDALLAADARRLFLAAGIHFHVDLGDEGSSLAGGPVLIAPGGVGQDIPGSQPVRDAGDARAIVRDLVDADAAPRRLSVIFDRGRSRRGMTVSTLEAILDESGDTPVAVYVGTWRDAFEALETGARWIVQVPPGPLPEPVLELVRNFRPAWTPTIAVGADFMALMAEEGLRNSEALSRALPAEMRTDYGEVRVPQGRLTEARLQNEDRLLAVVGLAGAGATLVAGSQSGGLGTAHGWSLLRELEWWGRAGIGTWEVLAGATVHGAALLGIPPGFTVGAPANFTLYAGSPVEDADELFRPEVVFVDGEPEDPAALAARVRHALTEDVPGNPLPGGNSWSLLIIAVVGFAILLGLRRLVKRAAANAAES